MDNNSYLDKPQFDNTPQAHPAFLRGKRQGIEEIVSIVNNVVKGVDYGDGQVASPIVENCRRNVLTLKRQAQEALEPKGNSEALKEFVIDLLYDREKTKQYALSREEAEACQAILKWKEALVNAASKTGYLAKKATEALEATLKVPLVKEENSVENEEK